MDVLHTIYNTKSLISLCQGILHQDVFVLPYLSYNISYLKKVMDKCLRISYIINHVTLHPGGNSVEFIRNPCSTRSSA